MAFDPLFHVVRFPVRPRDDAPPSPKVAPAARARVGLEDGDGTLKPTEEPRPLLPTTGQKWTPRAEAPKHGGLHQLTLASLQRAPQGDAPKLDFSTYPPGFNNRVLLGAIAADLEKLMGLKIPYGYAQSLETFSADPGPTALGFAQLKDGGYRIGEKAIDKLLTGVTEPKAREAIASFAIAHEYFHAYLNHADIVAWSGNAPKGFRVKQSEAFRKVAELQVDYLATKYLMLRGLPTDAVLTMFETGDFPASKDYPSGRERADNVRRALEPGFALELFQNDVLDCLAFLDFLSG